MSRSPSAARFSFQAKVLAPVLAFLVLLPSVTLWIINRNISEQALAEARRTLTTADAVFRNSLDILGRGMATRFRGVVNEPRFKAVAQLGDAKTMADFLRDSMEELGGEIEFITYSLQPGTMLAGARHDKRLNFELFLGATSALAHDAFEGEVGLGTVFVSGRTYSAVSVPVASSDRLSVAGVLTIGLRFGNQALQDLKSLTRADIVIFSEGHPTAATLSHEPAVESPSHQDEPSEGQRRVMTVEVEGEHFLALTGDYVAAAGRPGFHYHLLSSYESRLQSLRETQLMLAGVSLVGILVSGGSVWFMIRKITRPLRALRDGAEAIGRGDFTQRVDQFSNDECGELAGAFNQMTGNLLTSRTELEQTVDRLKSTDARLRESEEQLRLTIESARDHMICTLDARGRVQRWNSAAERILRYTAAEAQGLAYANFFAPEQCSSGVPSRLLAMATATGCDVFEGWRIRRDGTRFWADVTLSRLPDGAGFVEIARDSTLRKEAEETLRSARDTAENANRAKTEFIANMSHELRTPMNAIIGMSSLLLDEQLPDDTRDCVGTIRSSADDLLEIIDDILDISKIESGRLELDQQPFDLCGCIESVVDLFSARCQERDIGLSVHLARDLPAIVVGDNARLRQVLGNLIGNALKFTERGGVTVSASVGKSAKGEEELRFSVQDTGIGIPANRMDRLFKMFSQVDASMTRRFGGTGLGLAISRRLVELMGGAIGVESEVGVGSRFYFSICAPSEPPRVAPEFSGLERRRVLVVGINKHVTSGVCQQLTTWGLQVTEAATLEEVVAPCDVVVLADDIGTNLTDTIHGSVLPVVQLARPGPNRLNVAGAPHVMVHLPVKPRAIHAALVKVLALSQRPRNQAPRPPSIGGEFAEAHPLRILLVEDNPVNARVALLLLKRLGYVAEWATDGRKALDCLAGQDFDLVLMDLQMPGMDGLEATRTLLASGPAERLPYIVALTANARQDDRDACALAGMHDFISKPVQLETLSKGLDRGYRWILARKSGTATSAIAAVR